MLHWSENRRNKASVGVCVFGVRNSSQENITVTLLQYCYTVVNLILVMCRVRVKTVKGKRIK